MKINWKTSNAKYTSGQDGFVGKWRIFDIFYDGIKRIDEKEILTCYLPGIKRYLGNFKTKEEAGYSYASAEKKYYGDFSRSSG